MVGSGTVGVLVRMLIAAVVGVLALVLVLVLFAAVVAVAGASLVVDAQPAMSSAMLTRSVMAMERCMIILDFYDMTVLYYNEWYLLCI